MTFVESITDGLSYIEYTIAPRKYRVHLSDGADRAVADINKRFTYGIGQSWFRSAFFLCKHSHKEAQIYKYVKSAYTRVVTYALPSEYDVCQYRSGEIFDWKCRGKSRAVAIDTGTELFEVCGTDGSVCLHMPYRTGANRVCNLYRLLGMLNRSFGGSLFQYKTIMLYSDRDEYTTVIELCDGRDADIFFTKLAMDCAGKSDLFFDRSEGVLVL